MSGSGVMTTFKPGIVFWTSERRDIVVEFYGHDGNSYAVYYMTDWAHALAHFGAILPMTDCVIEIKVTEEFDRVQYVAATLTDADRRRR